MNGYDANSYARAYVDALMFLVEGKPAEQARLLAWVEAEIDRLPVGSDGFQRVVPLNLPTTAITPEQRARRAALAHLRGRLNSRLGADS